MFRFNGLAGLGAALAMFAIVGCGDESSSADRAPTTPSAVAATPDDKGEGVARFVVDAFNEGLADCDYVRVTRDLASLAELFAPGAEGGLLGQSPLADSEAPSRSVAQPRTELAQLSDLFPGGTLAARFVPGFDDILDWPFNYDPEGADVISRLDGRPFGEVCEAVIGYLAGAERKRFRAEYRADATIGDDESAWILSFPIGSAADGTLDVVENRRLVTRRVGTEWKIAAFVPFPES